MELLSKYMDLCNPYIVSLSEFMTPPPGWTMGEFIGSSCRVTAWTKLREITHSIERAPVFSLGSPDPGSFAIGRSIRAKMSLSFHRNEDFDNYFQRIMFRSFTARVGCYTFEDCRAESYDAEIDKETNNIAVHINVIMERMKQET
jgi:hypothetical protein